jgi:hypothetical protein
VASGDPSGLKSGLQIGRFRAGNPTFLLEPPQMIGDRRERMIDFIRERRDWEMARVLLAT